MGAKTDIEWTDATWNPIRGCSRVSEGCRNCYAEGVAARFSGDFHNVATKGDLAPFYGFAKLTASGPRWTGKVEIVEKHLCDPLSWKQPRRIFVNSMSDLFHEGLPDEAIDRVFAVMALCDDHTFQILTKRPERMQRYMDAGKDREVAISLAITRTPWWDSPRSSPCAVGAIEDRIGAGPLSNVWLGVSVEDQATADARIPLLLRTPAGKRFISYEPALGPINLDGDRAEELHALGCGNEPDCNCGTPRLDWVICGGESGPNARPMPPEWPRLVRDQCREANVPFFFKQWGAWTPGENVERRCGIVQTATWFNDKWSFSKENLAHTDGHIEDEPDLYRVGKKAAGALLDGREHKEFPGAER